MIPSLMKIYREEGWAGYMRGNGVNVLRIAPYSAVRRAPALCFDFRSNCDIDSDSDVDRSNSRLTSYSKMYYALTELKLIRPED